MSARVYALEAKYEFLKQVRMPAYAIPSITFPVMFYLLFGVMFGGGRPAAGTTVATYLLATYATFGVIGAALFGFGVGVAYAVYQVALNEQPLSQQLLLQRPSSRRGSSNSKSSRSVRLRLHQETWRGLPPMLQPLAHLRSTAQCRLQRILSHPPLLV